MATLFRNWLSRNVRHRGLIQSNVYKSTFIQMIGFTLIGLGVAYISIFLFPRIAQYFSCSDSISGESMGICFFIIMLGVGFAFPELLKGDKDEGLSTMRIVVFMMTNVICLLLIKIGWNPEINNLEEIGLDGYWVSVIAFIFGGKAAQYYFESKLAAPKAIPSLNKAEIAKMAVVQHRDALLARYPNIESVSDSYDGAGDYVVTIYLKHDNSESLPKELPVSVQGSETMVRTEIIPDSGIGEPHGGTLTDEISDKKTPAYYGSVCCVVESTKVPGLKGVVTSGHVFTNGRYEDYGGPVNPSQATDTLINGNKKGKLYIQQMEYNQDIAIAANTAEDNWLPKHLSFASGFYQVKDTDVKTPVANATILSRNDNERHAFILDYNVSFEIKYKNTSRYIRNIILIGSTNDRATSRTVSAGGDSGSCVYDRETKKLIGMLLGGNKKFSFVLPLENSLQAFNFKTI
ncbi:MAG TPA: hypothetical protein VK528_00785 [Flavobacterium sp.]|nr:hypothetical protein [Flavobacterium sp.]